MRIKAGEYRWRAQLQRATSTKNAIGEKVKTWATVAIVWAKKVERSGGEQVRNEQVQATKRVEVWLRAPLPDEVSEPTTKDRVSVDGQTFNVEAVLDSDERGKGWILVCGAAV